MVDGEEKYEVEAILRNKGKGARRLYLVMWKGSPITEACHITLNQHLPSKLRRWW